MTYKSLVKKCYVATVVCILSLAALLLPEVAYAKVIAPSSQERSVSRLAPEKQTLPQEGLEFEQNKPPEQNTLPQVMDVKVSETYAQLSWWEKQKERIKQVVTFGVKIVNKTIDFGNWIYTSSKQATRTLSRVVVSSLSKIGQPIARALDKVWTRTHPLAYPVTKNAVANLYKAQFVNPENVEKDGVVSEWNSETDTCTQMSSKTIEVKSGSGKKRILYVNGINTSYEAHCATMKKIHEITCCDVSGVYNATEGMVVDLWQSASDRTTKSYRQSTNKATIALIELLKGQNSLVDMEFWCHSQGGIICSSALSYSAREFAAIKKEYLLNDLRVVTFGAAAETWTTGPRYEHFINVQDLVSGDLGLGDTAGYWQKHAGGDHKVHLFSGVNGKHINFKNPKRKWIRDVFFNSHFMDSTYIPAYKAFYPNLCK